MYERSAIVLERYFENLLGYRREGNLRDNFNNYCELVEKLEKYQINYEKELTATEEFEESLIVIHNNKLYIGDVPQQQNVVVFKRKYLLNVALTFPDAIRHISAPIIIKIYVESQNNIKISPLFTHLQTKSVDNYPMYNVQTVP